MFTALILAACCGGSPVSRVAVVAHPVRGVVHRVQSRPRLRFVRPVQGFAPTFHVAPAAVAPKPMPSTLVPSADLEARIQTIEQKLQDGGRALLFLAPKK